MLHGKGLWAYRKQELERALQIAPQMGATHILYKVGQGPIYYPGMAQVAQQISAAGLTPMAWMWLLLDDPQAEAQVAVQAFQDGFRGFIFDTEADRVRNRFERAEQLGDFIRVAGLDLTRLYNCSFPNISHHRDLPYDQLNEFCKGGLMPMAYGTYFPPQSTVPPEVQAQRVIDEWTYGHYEYWVRHWGYRPPLYPVLGPYHDEYGHVRMPPAEFQIWLDQLEDHAPSFFSVFTAAVLNEDLLPLIEAFPLGEGPPPSLPPTGLKVQVYSPEVGYLNVRPIPSTELPPTTRVNHGTVLDVLEPEAQAKPKIGTTGEWLHVRTPDGSEGYVAAWYVRLHEVGVTPPVEVIVVSPEVGYLNVRPTPSTNWPPVTRADDGMVLEALDPEGEVREKAGKLGAWIQVRTPTGIEGYVYAYYVRMVDEAIELLTVHSLVGLNVRRGPGTDTSVRWRVPDRTVLEVLEDPTQVQDKLGKDAWVKVRTPSLREGYVNGLYVQAKRLADKRVPVPDDTLPYGESAWIFGIHAAGATTAADFRHLFQDKDKTGWVLFTEEIGADPHHGGGHDYTPWSHAGYGVIVRLNHRYEPGGTLPVQAKYPDFAQACANYVQNSAGCHIWIIGNEQNNVREHPGGAEDPVEHITPQRYAEAFNLARPAIKAVQEEAVVVPGAVDPYNTYPWAQMGGKRYRPLDYFQEMLEAIDDLDGIALHTYTHWLDVGLITQPTVFLDPFLQPDSPHEHYYDFLAYRPFAEAIPEKWRDRPIYITETNHWLALEHQPETPTQQTQVGWLNKNKGWIRAAYQEIQRWNSTPHVQQIHCLLIYRWTGDAWAIEDLGKVQEDFRQALDHDYRWRR